MRNDPHIQQGFAHEFVSCACTQDEEYVHKGCCATPNKNLLTIGKKWATPLTGFITGAAVATLFLAPWLFILGGLSSEIKLPA